MEKSVRKKAMVIAVWRGSQMGDVKVLLLARPAGSRDYEWQPITGNGESGEDFLEIATREAREETQLAFQGQPNALGLEHAFRGRFGPVVEAAFTWELAESPTPPTPVLDPKEHDRFRWMSPKEAWAMLPFPHQREAVLLASAPPSPLVLSTEGTWWQDGEEITHKRTIDLLRRGLGRETLPGGKNFYQVTLGRETVPVIVKDTAEFIDRIDLNRGAVHLLNGERWIGIEPEAFQVGAENVLYATIDGERIRFLRPAYYELTKDVETEVAPDGSVEYRLNWGGNRHRLWIPR